VATYSKNVLYKGCGIAQDFAKQNPARGLDFFQVYKNPGPGEVGD
jgi:hypothetical protein